MAGLYIHIPFCRQACRYCDFYFSVSLKYKEDIVACIIEEIKHKEEFHKYIFDTVYFGGGTPSVLEEKDIESILKEIHHYYTISKNAEITLEANPDDLSSSYLEMLKRHGFNRLSVGIQSFNDKDLMLMRRSHNASQAISAIRNAHEIGISNINIDLIYGVPGMSFREWEENLETAFKLNISHLSAYHLSYEAGTVFDHWRKKKKIIPVDEEESLNQLKYLKERTKNEGFLHYEISNFSKKGFQSKHNTNYWKGVPYLGLGPAAHSYDGKSRYWNVSSIKTYIEKTRSGEFNYTDKEELSLDDCYNEYVLTGLRTMWGMDMGEIRNRFGENYVKYTEKIAKELINKDLLWKDNQKISITEKGIFLADQIIRDFFRV